MEPMNPMPPRLRTLNPPAAVLAGQAARWFVAAALSLLFLLALAGCTATTVDRIAARSGDLKERYCELTPFQRAEVRRIANADDTGAKAVIVCPGEPWPDTAP